MRGRMKAVATAAAALLVLAGCGGGGGTSGGGGGPDKITVGVIPIVDVAPLYLGIKQGFFKEQNLDVKVETAQGGAAIVPGVVSGQFQFGFSNVTSLLLARAQGVPLKIVAAGNYSTGVQGKDFSAIVVPKGSPITNAAELEGKTVAVNTLKNVGDTTVRRSVEKAGGNPDAVKFTELPFPDMPAALSEGRVDAAWLVEPFLTIAKDQGGKEIASNLVDTYKDLMIAAYFTNEQLIKTNPDLVKRFTAAMNKSLDYAQQNQEAARKIILEYTQIPPAVAQQMVLPKWSSQISTGTVDVLAALALRDGLVKQKIDTQALLP